jgi:tetratricopeptide (TPR) repeat protein
MKATILVCALVATLPVQRVGYAGPTDARQAERERVEKLEADARAAADPEKYAEVGAAYLQLYSADPKAPGGDELLYNAGVAYESGRAIGAAIQAFALIERHYPTSKLRPRALARLARIYGDIAMYDKAAEKLEEYGTRYAGEKDAVDAMSDAIYFRKAIGDRDKAIANTRYFIKTFGAKRPRETADAMWSLTALYDEAPDRAIAHLREYLRSFGAKGDAARVVIAHAKIGQLLWNQSCRARVVDGLCVRDNDRAMRTCGTGTARTLTPIARDPAKVKEALAELVSAIKEFERRQAIDDPIARYFYAQAKLAVADAKLEPYLALAFPRNLDFDRDKRAAYAKSMKRFSEWIEQKQRDGGNVTRRYEEVLAAKDAASSITAAARIGIVAQSFASSLVTGPIPRDVRTGPNAADKTKAFCDAMTDVAEPLEASSLNAFAVCLAKSTELSWFGDSSRQCERELTRMKPDDFPRSNELRAAPVFVAPVIAAEPALR